MSVPSTGVTVDDLNLLREWRDPVTPARLLRNAIGSMVVHVLALVLVILLPEDRVDRREPEIRPNLRKAVHIVLPRSFEPTQKEPNKGKITRELDVRSVRSAPAPQAPRFRAPQPVPGPVTAARSAPAPVIEQPRIQVPQEAPPQILSQPVQQPQLAVSPPQPEKPKLAFESIDAQPVQHVVAPHAVPIPRANRSIESGAGGAIVGDIGDSSTTIPNLSNAASAGRIGSNLQLLSDAKGVDFKPYLIQVLTAVRRNWLSIIPESARMGRRGRVLIQFAIDRSGGVPKLVIAEGAGTDALDRAAVSAISASYPFPPLPADYKGDQIRVQLAFAYNLPAR